MQLKMAHRVLMHMDIDEAGGDDPARGVYDLVRRRLLPGHLGYPAVLQQQVQLGLNTVGRIDQQTVFDERFHGWKILSAPLASKTGGPVFYHVKRKKHIRQGNCLLFSD